MTLQKSLETILALEREGKRLLAEAERQGRGERERAREEAEKLRRDTEETISEESEKFRAQLETEIEGAVGAVTEKANEEERRIRSLAERNRAKALKLILRWLRER